MEGQRGQIEALKACIEAERALRAKVRGAHDESEGDEEDNNPEDVKLISFIPSDKFPEKTFVKDVCESSVLI